MEKFDLRTKEGRRAYYIFYQKELQDTARLYYHKHRDAILEQRNADKWK